MVTIKDGCGCDLCDCDWKQKLKEAYSRAIQSVNKIGDETGRVYFPDGTGFVKMPLPTKEQIDSIEEIDGIKASVDNLNKTVPALETQVTGVTKSLVSNVEVLNGTTAGKFKVRIDREKAALIDSNDYDLSKVNSIELIQGSGPAMVKAQLTLSDGTVLRSDDFLFTTESIGTDVYISSFTFKAGNVDGTISADIGLNNGTTLEANNFVVPTDPSVVSTITDLQTRMAAVEGGSIGGLDELKATVDGHTASINALDSDVANLQIDKADLDNPTQSIKAGYTKLDYFCKVKGTRIDSELGQVDTYYAIRGGDSLDNPLEVSWESTTQAPNGEYVNLPIGKVAFLNQDGTPANFSTGGDGWEEVDLNNWPTDWVANERIKIDFKAVTSSSSPYVGSNESSTAIIEFTLLSTSSTTYINMPIHTTALSITYLILSYANGNNFTAGSGTLMSLTGLNVSNNTNGNAAITLDNITTYIRKMWRKRP